MICPQCGKLYAGSEDVCKLCAVPLQAPPSSAAPAPGFASVRPPGIDQTLESIRRDINTIDQRSVRPAGFFIRVLASFLDNLILTLITLVVSVAAYLVMERSGTPVSFEPNELMDSLWLLFSMPNMLLACMYFIYFHAVTGQTVGKLICGVQVVAAEGNRSLGWWRSIVRCAGYFLCSFLLCIGFLWVLVNRRKRGWHDYMAGSVVIYKED